MNRLVVLVAVILGVVFLALGVTYFLVPAGSLPSHLPGFVVDSTHIRFKHGIGALILAVALFALAWFQSGPGKA